MEGKNRIKYHKGKCLKIKMTLELSARTDLKRRKPCHFEIQNFKIAHFHLTENFSYYKFFSVKSKCENSKL